MSIFGKIKAAIFGSAEAAPAKPTAVAGASPAAPPPAPAPAAAAPAPSPAAPSPAIPKAPPVTPVPPAAPASPPPLAAPVDVAKVLSELAAQRKEKLDWKRSIVDLMKLLDLDSGFAARKELAHELGYKGDTGDSAAMNIWLHKQVMTKLAENGGKVPAELKD